jgi:hypothetical protein
VGGSDTGTTVLDRLVCNGELSQVVADHLGLHRTERKQSQKCMLVWYSLASSEQQRAGISKREMDSTSARAR